MADRPIGHSYGLDGVSRRSRDPARSREVLPRTAREGVSRSPVKLQDPIGDDAVGVGPRDVPPPTLALNQSFNIRFIGDGKRHHVRPTRPRKDRFRGRSARAIFIRAGQKSLHQRNQRQRDKKGEKHFLDPGPSRPFPLAGFCLAAELGLPAPPGARSASLGQTRYLDGDSHRSIRVPDRGR